MSLCMVHVEKLGGGRVAFRRGWGGTGRKAAPARAALRHLSHSHRRRKQIQKSLEGVTANAARHNKCGTLLRTETGSDKVAKMQRFCWA
eukprot:365492-Chlamydomonas_euryale.AAC.18